MIYAVPNRFKYRHNAPVSVFLFLSFFPLRFRIVSNNVKMYHLLSLISIFFTAVPNSLECRQYALFSVLDFSMFSEVPYRMRCRKNAPFSVLILKIVPAVPNRFKCHQNATFTVLVLKTICEVRNPKFLTQIPRSASEHGTQSNLMDEVKHYVSMINLYLRPSP